MACLSSGSRKSIRLSQTRQHAPQGYDPLLAFFLTDAQSRTEPDRPTAASEDQHPALERELLEAIPGLGVRQVEGAHETPAARVRDSPGVLLLKLLELGEKKASDLARALHEFLLFDDLEVAPEADHVDQVPAPGGVDARGLVKDVLLHLVDTATREDAANLGFFSEHQDVGREAEVLIGPHFSREPDTGLHLVDDEQELVLEGELPQFAQELRPKVIVAPFALDRLDDERRDLVGVVFDRLFDLAHRFLLRGDHLVDLGG